MNTKIEVTRNAANSPNMFHSSPIQVKSRGLEQSAKDFIMRFFMWFFKYVLNKWVFCSRAATVVGIPKISRYTDFSQNSVFLEAKGGALLNVQKSVKLGKTWQNLAKISKKGVNPNFLVAALFCSTCLDFPIPLN